MNKEQFIKLAVQSGYGKEEAAREYTEANDKAEYDTDDFNALHHWSPNCMHWSKCKSDRGLRPIFGLNGRTTAMSNGIAGTSGAGQDWR